MKKRNLSRNKLLLSGYLFYWVNVKFLTLLFVTGKYFFMYSKYERIVMFNGYIIIILILVSLISLIFWKRIVLKIKNIYKLTIILLLLILVFFGVTYAVNSLYFVIEPSMIDLENKLNTLYPTLFNSFSILFFFIIVLCQSLNKGKEKGMINTRS